MKSLDQVIISVKQLLRRPIAFYPALAELGGSVAAGIFLSQACYWSSTLPPDRDGWFYKTQQEWESETYLSRKQQESARAAWIKLGILEEERKGNPAQLWYRVDFGSLQGCLGSEVQTRLPKTDNLDCPEGTDKIVPKGQTLYTENTSETTTESEGAGICPECGFEKKMCMGHKKPKVKTWPNRPRFEKESRHVQEVPTRTRGEEARRRRAEAFEILRRSPAPSR